MLVANQHYCINDIEIGEIISIQSVTFTDNATKWNNQKNETSQFAPVVRVIPDEKKVMVDFTNYKDDFTFIYIYHKQGLLIVMQDRRKQNPYFSANSPYIGSHKDFPLDGIKEISKRFLSCYNNDEAAWQHFFDIVSKQIAVRVVDEITSYKIAVRSLGETDIRNFINGKDVIELCITNEGLSGKMKGKVFLVSVLDYQPLVGVITNEITGDVRDIIINGRGLTFN